MESLYLIIWLPFFWAWHNKSNGWILLYSFCKHFPTFHWSCRCGFTITCATKRKKSFSRTQNQRDFSVETSLNSSCRASALNEAAMKDLHSLLSEYLGVELSCTKRECLQLSEQSSEKYANIFTVQEQMWLRLLTWSKGTRSNADFPYQFFSNVFSD